MSVARSGGIEEGVSARVVALLTLAAFINYVDRGNLATAGPLIREQFALSNAQLGLLLSAFFWSYAPGQLPAGWLAERLDARRVLAAGLAMWGVATALMGLASGFMMLLVLRVMLGVGESVMYPASFKILAREALDGERGRANGWMAAGQLSGPALGTLAGGLLMAWFGWRVVFVAAGCASLLWLWPWLRTPRAAALRLAHTTPDGPPTRALLRSRELWGSCLGNFGQTYGFYLVLSWLPVYLVKTHGLTMAQMAPLGAGVFALSAVTSVLTGWASDRWLKAGASSNRVRKTALLVGLAGLAACLSACAFAGPLGALAAMAGCGLCLGVLTPAIWASAQTLAGPGAAARWWGVQNFFANLGGISAPVITGVVVDRTGTFASAFLIAAASALVGALAYGVIVRRIETIDWRATDSRALAAALPEQVDAGRRATSPSRAW
ncbi:MAG TPA: MFS transporter [Steroidobacteraceae bacterium]